MTHQNNAGKATTATAKPKSARVGATKSNDFHLEKSPLGWHFNGKHEVPLFSLWDYLETGDSTPLVQTYYKRQALKWQVAFWIAFAGFLAVSAMSLIK
jgi:hypothetical protein